MDEPKVSLLTAPIKMGTSTTLPPARGRLSEQRREICMGHKQAEGINELEKASIGFEETTTPSSVGTHGI